ncbi:MAG TPA: HD domain-containing phosphohydrolase [Pirellulales bacterium]|nr:HD domain-containing phosphohydrolase [Pirellulales bacterium]
MPSIGDGRLRPFWSPEVNLASETTSEAVSTGVNVPAIGAVSSAKIMIVDDEPLNVRTVRRHLTMAGYQNFITTSDSAQALVMLGLGDPDVVLLDIVMPDPGGLEVLSQIRSVAQFEQLPVIILTAIDNSAVKAQALNLGATDFITKPVDPNDLVPRVRNALSLKAYHDHLQDYARQLKEEVCARTEELEESRVAIIQSLARAAEYRDNETGRHALRVGRYAATIARQLRLPEQIARVIELAAPLHDVGKIGIPDAILLKPGKLTPEEIEVMQKHCSYGKRIFEPMAWDELRTYRTHTEIGQQLMGVCRAPVLDMAASIALTHHERWDGAGYPLGLAGENIPIEGRITAVADTFDALSSKRIYKPAFPLDKCIAILNDARGGQFDPAVLDAFLDCRQEIVRIQLAYAEIN